MKGVPGEVPIRILIVDEHPIVRAGLRMLLENQPRMTVVGEAGSRGDAVAVAGREQPDMILLDLDLGAENGLDFLPELLSVAATAQVLVLTGIRDSEVHQRAVRLGAKGVVLKEKTADVLIKAMEKVHAGEAWLDRSTVSKVLARMSKAGEANGRDPEAAKIATLTARERDVIALVARGLGTKQIAEHLFISEKTVRNHLASIYSKLEVSYRLELAIYAYNHGLGASPV